MAPSPNRVMAPIGKRGGAVRLGTRTDNAPDRVSNARHHGRCRLRRCPGHSTGDPRMRSLEPCFSSTGPTSRLLVETEHLRPIRIAASSASLGATMVAADGRRTGGSGELDVGPVTYRVIIAIHPIGVVIMAFGLETRIRVEIASSVEASPSSSSASSPASRPRCARGCQAGLVLANTEKSFALATRLMCAAATVAMPTVAVRCEID